MEIQYLGANSIKITTKKAIIAVDPVSDIAAIKPDLKKATAIIASQDTLLPTDLPGDIFVIQTPGEYEFEDYSVKGVATQPHTGSTGDQSATMYRIASGDITLLVTGHAGVKLNEEQLEQIGVVDVVIIPVGGNGYTLDAVEAADMVRALEPKLVIPTHYAQEGLSYSVPQDDLTAFTKELGATMAEDTPEKLKLKTLPEQLTIQALRT